MRDDNIDWSTWNRMPKKSGKKNAPVEHEPDRAAKSEPIKNRLKKLLIRNPRMPLDDLMNVVCKDGSKTLSRFAVSNIRAEFFHSIKLLQRLGYLRKIKL